LLVLHPKAQSRAEDRLASFQSFLGFVNFCEGILSFKTAAEARCLNLALLEDSLPQQNLGFLGGRHLKLMGGVEPNEVLFFVV